MNWKQKLNPWGYARGLEIALDIKTSESDVLDRSIKTAFAELRIERKQLDKYFRLAADQDQKIIILKTELATALDALRIADERADKNAAACDAAHDSLPTEEDVKVFGCDLVIDESLAPTMFGVVGAFQTIQPVSFNERPITPDTRRTKPKTAAQIEAQEAREAEIAVKKAYQERDARGKFKARS